MEDLRRRAKESRGAVEKEGNSGGYALMAIAFICNKGTLRLMLDIIQMMPPRYGAKQVGSYGEMEDESLFSWV